MPGIWVAGNRSKFIALKLEYKNIREEVLNIDKTIITKMMDKLSLPEVGEHHTF